MKKILLIIVIFLIIIPATIISANDERYNIKIEENTIFENNIDLTVDIENMQENSSYSIKVEYEDNKVIEKDISLENEIINIKFDDEGIKNINVVLYKDNEEKINEVRTVYYIKPYEKQFLDELSNKSTTVHLRDTFDTSGSWDDYEKSFDLIKKVGIRNIRTDIFYNYAEGEKRSESTKEEYWKYCDEWIQKASENNINVVLLLSSIWEDFDGGKAIVYSDDDINKFTVFANKILERYPQIVDFEIINEPNYNSRYVTEERVEAYSKLVSDIYLELKSKNQNINILTGGLAWNKAATPDVQMLPKDFYNLLNKYNCYKYADSYAIHAYGSSNEKIQNNSLISKLVEYKNICNDSGGFLKQYITEYGVSSSKDIEKNSITEEIQANMLVQQTVLMDYYNADYANIYNFKNVEKYENESTEGNYGLMRSDYTPKLSYYAIKNLLTNTNGAEYIGAMSIDENLEAHLYDKDGKPLLIVWSKERENEIKIEYKDFKAKDIYGKEIKPDDDNKITITTSPVYFEEIDCNYFYQSISNTIIEKYNEFEEKYAEQILSATEIQDIIQTLKQNIQNISNFSSLADTIAIDMMKSHYNIGNSLINAYKEKNLDIEYVTLSSMLDMLDDIGNSYEDLITVSTCTQNIDLVNTAKAIKNVEDIINDNQELNMVYPSKILELSKDFYETADYIKGLDEENDIKSGLISSKGLHSELLANWATEFANIYIDEYIENNPVEIIYSYKELTNEDVIATLTSDAEINVTNNLNSKEHIFTENGTFEFEYTIKGQAFTKIATVNNIDKTPPIITGVENGQTYESVMPVITDEHSITITLSKDGIVQEDYKQGDIITEVGNYELIVKDAATNTTIITFSIEESKTQIEITSEKYEIDDKYITKIQPKTTVMEFKIAIETNATEIKIYNKNNETINDDEKIGTGMKVELKNGNETKTFTVIVRGDINGDGETDFTDILKINQARLNKIILEEMYSIAADVTEDGKVDFIDIVKINKFRLHKIDEV